MFKRKKNKQNQTSNVENSLEVYQPTSKKRIARVVLNGYNIEQENSLGKHGALCSFKVVEGDLWHEWHGQHILILKTLEGQQADIKITAMPSDRESYGLIEFI